ncbi:MAG: hypothetical protein IKO57_08470 [Treponema sp.]|nr:hypothetical protein [Treponema sp.]
MGAIWDFISGKSTDWDAVNRQQEAYERTRPKRIRYTAYCRRCGNGGYDSLMSRGISERTPQEAIRMLQNSDNGCGRGNHDPQVQEL